VQAVPTGVRPKSVPERPAPAVADSSGGWPRLVKTGTSGADKAVKTTQHRQYSKRLARGERDPESKPAHRGKRLAHNEREADITASIAKKKRKPQTAEQSQGGSLWR